MPKVLTVQEIYASTDKKMLEKALGKFSKAQKKIKQPDRQEKITAIDFRLSELREEAKGKAKKAEKERS